MPNAIGETYKLFKINASFDAITELPQSDTAGIDKAPLRDLHISLTNKVLELFVKLTNCVLICTAFFVRLMPGSRYREICDVLLLTLQRCR